MIKNSCFNNLIIKLLLLLCAVGLIVGISLHYYDNFHVVIPNQYYRSAQLSPTELTNIVKRYHIQSLINLRGKNPKFSWYKRELQTGKKLKLNYYSIPLHAKGVTSKQQLKQLVSILTEAPIPVLIHCESGSDRSGLAAAVILLLHNNSVAQAKKQISLYYGAYAHNTTGRIMLDRYKQWLAQQHQPSSNRRLFLQWLDS